MEDCDELAQAIAEHPADSPIGFIFEIDMEYPEELHKAHNAYPLAPEHMVVQKEWMSDYHHNLLGVEMVPTKVEKLVLNLRSKDCYVLHYCNLQLNLSLRMHLRKIRCALRFKQSPWMEPYIRMNTELRKKATSDFEKGMYKLMNNNAFRKTTENLRKRVDVKPKRKTNTGALLPAQPLPKPTYSIMTLRQSRFTRVAWC